MRTATLRTCLALALFAVLSAPLAAQTPPPATGAPPLGSPGTGATVTATGVCTISGPVLSPNDFGVPAGQPVADVSTTMLADGRIRIYAFAQGQGIRSAVSVSADGLSFVPEAGSRLRDGSGMPRIIGDPVGGYRLFFTSGDGIKSALSADGLTFTEEAGFRISKEQAGFTDAAGALQAVSGATVVAVPTGGYRMYFSDLPRPGETPGGHRVKSAVSADMVNWEVEAGIRLGEGAPVLTDTAEHPYALAHPDGSVTLYYGKFSLTPGVVEGAYFSTATDGLTFTTETLGVFSGNDPDGIRRQDGTLLLYYGGFDPLIGGTVSVAACPDPAVPAAVAETPATSTPVSTSAPMSATITISNTGVSPNSVTIAVGGTVTFINNDSRAHDMSSDPHPQHSDCSAVNQAGFVAPGQSRTTTALTTARTCGFHDHDQPNNRNLQGTIIIR